MLRISDQKRDPWSDICTRKSKDSALTNITLPPGPLEVGPDPSEKGDRAAEAAANALEY